MPAHYHPPLISVSDLSYATTGINDKKNLTVKWHFLYYTAIFGTAIDNVRGDATGRGQQPNVGGRW